MKSSKLVALALLSCLALPDRSTAQEEMPAPTPTAEDLARKKKLIGKLGFVRLWYFSSAEDRRITLCARPGGGEPRVIASHVRAGSMRNYRVLRPGKYEILILEGSVVPDASGRITIPEKKLAAPVPIELKPGQFSTILVTSKDGNFTCEVLKDSPPAEPGQTVFRIFDFNLSPKEVIRLIAGGKPSAIWTSGSPNPTIKTFQNLKGTVHLEWFSIASATPLLLGSYELEPPPDSAYSVALFKDRYGQNTISVEQDAEADFDEEEAQSLAQSAP